jgi:hypothetical protein
MHQCDGERPVLLGREERGTQMGMRATERGPVWICDGCGKDVKDGLGRVYVRETEAGVEYLVFHKTPECSPDDADIRSLGWEGLDRLMADAAVSSGAALRGRGVEGA